MAIILSWKEFEYKFTQINYFKISNYIMMNSSVNVVYIILKYIIIFIFIAKYISELENRFKQKAIL